MPDAGQGTFSAEELIALLRDASVSPESIASEMEDAGAAPLPVEQLASARAVVQGFAPESVERLPGLDERLRADLVDAAIDARAVEFVAALAASADKALAKLGKRAIHVLRTKGVTVEPRRAAPAPASPAAPAHEELPCLMSAIDSHGERLLFLPVASRGGIDLVQIVFSDTTGIVAARLHAIGRKEFRRFIQEIGRSGDLLTAEVPRSYARSLVTAALDLNAAARKPVPAEFNDVSFLLGATGGRQPSPGRALAPESGPERERLVAGSARLFDLREVSGWRPPEETLAPLSRRLEEISVSPLYVDDRQRAESVERTLGDAAEQFWVPVQRGRYAERLYDTALLLDRAGRHDDARLAAATAAALESEAPAASIPFCRRLFDRRPLPGLEEPGMAAARESSGGLILPP